MTYEKSKDRILSSRTIGDGNRGIDISICSYDNGEPKIQISRWVLINETKVYRKIGRISFDEFNEIVKNLVEMVKKVEGYDIKFYLGMNHTNTVKDEELTL